MKELGEKLRAVREVLELNQTALAERLGRQQRDISDLEKGKRKALPQEYIDFLVAEGLDLNWLFGNQPLKHPDPYLQQYQHQRATGEPAVPGQAPPLNTRMVPRHLLQEYPHQHQKPEYLRELQGVNLPGAEFAGGPDTMRGFQMPDDSMQDALSPFDWIIARRSNTPLHHLQPGYIYVVITRHQVVIGRLAARRQGEEGLRMVFDQEAYPPLHLEERNIQEIWRGQARLSATLTGSRQSLQRQLEGINSTLEELRDRLPNQR